MEGVKEEGGKRNKAGKGRADDKGLQGSRACYLNFDVLCVISVHLCGRYVYEYVNYVYQT